MEVTNEADAEIDDVNMIPEPDADSIAQEEPANKKPTRVAQVVRAVRDKSVDMTSDDGQGSTPPAHLRSPLNGVTSAEAQREERPLLDEQIRRIEELAKNISLAEGAKGFIISNEWLLAVQNGGDKAQTINPVDNRCLIEDSTPELWDETGERFYPLKPGLSLDSEIQILPQEAWGLITRWYGTAPESPVLVRYCHNTSTGQGSENAQFEIYPPIFTVTKLADPAAGMSTLTDRTARSVKLVASRSISYRQFLKQAKEACRVDMASKVRVWRILDVSQESAQTAVGMMTPAQSRESSPAPANASNTSTIGDALLMDLTRFASLQLGSQREAVDAKDETNNTKYNGNATLDLVGLGQEGLLVLEPQISGPAGGEWVSDSASAQVPKKGLLSASNINGKTRSNAGSGRTSPAPQGMMTRGRAQKNGRTKGTVGLGNLGNTCYMNSALQCVRSVKELTEYFLTDKYKKELNPSNPLAHNGEVAKAYAALLREIYNGNSGNSFSPRHFKNTIGKYGPSFSGYGQQDSQEFLLFLLDGLQEDLNRIHKKPYIEKPDSTDEMVSNKAELAKFADTCWDIYKKRNDSVITDLFAGMYKSTVKCPVCSKVSIIFDPFNNLTLQLPVENMWSRTVVFYPLNLRPIDIHIEIDKNSSVSQLLELVGNKVSVQATRLIMTEIYQHKFYKLFEPGIVLAEERIADGDHVAVFELEQEPTNYPPPKRKKFRSFYPTESDDDCSDEDGKLSDRLIVPIFHRLLDDMSSYRSTSKTLFGEPSYIMLTKEEAKDIDLILKKVLARVATMTTRDVLEEGKAPSSEEDADMVIMNNDTDSSSDSRVQAHSIQGEDGMVDVSMKDREDSGEVPRRSYPPLPKLHKPLPTMLRPEGYLIPEVRQLFEMRYMKSSDILPTGWNTFQEPNKKLPTIASRLPQPSNKAKTSEGEKLRRAIVNGSYSEDEIDDPPPARASARLRSSNSSDDDDDDELPPVKELIAQDHGIRTGRLRSSLRRKKLITYSRKGKASAGLESGSDVLQIQASEPLIRISESIVLDWTQDAYDALFGGSTSEDMKGLPVWDEPRSVLPDPEQDKKSLLRKRRQREGVTLDDCLDEFGKEEILSQNDAWYCPQCKEHRRASKKFELWKVPDVLVIHLKRFSAQGRFRDKLDLMVDFPTEGLDLTRRVAIDDGKELIYDLFAVDNHYGGLGGGHYTAFAQNFYDDSWYEYNGRYQTTRYGLRLLIK